MMIDLPGWMRSDGEEVFRTRVAIELSTSRDTLVRSGGGMPGVLERAGPIPLTIVWTVGSGGVTGFPRVAMPAATAAINISKPAMFVRNGFTLTE